MSWRQAALDRYYNRERGWIDGTTEFHTMCRGAIPAGASILEIGPGPTNPTTEMLASHGQVTGLDIDLDVKNNRFLESAETYDGSRFPFADATFDACVSDYELEHVSNVQEHFAEVHRVLKPGGCWSFRTPNRFHYVTMVAWLTPQWFHTLVANRLRDNPEGSHDPYPTVYAANSKGAITSLAAKNGFIIEVLRLIEKEPSYGMASRLLFYPFLVYERIVNSSEVFAQLRVNILAVLRRR